MSNAHRLLALLLIAPLAAGADAPMTVDADHAAYDEKRGEAIYSGNVQAVQGDLHVQSSQMQVFLKKGNVERIVATGHPARIRQTPKNAQAAVDSTAEKAEFFPAESRLLLTGRAVVRQGGNTYASDQIEYDTKNAVVTAGQKSGGGGKRVHVRIGGDAAP